MTKQISEKEKLLSMLTGIYDQLEELELVLESTFSDLRRSLNKEEHNKISVAKEKIKKFERKTFKMNDEIFDPILCQENRAMKLELGF